VSNRDCKSCDYFVDSGHSIGTCRRYPQFQTRSPNEWCGEFSPVPYAEPVPEMLALPVIDMPEEKPKRKYTKKVKND
jgi:hypothetical protein